MSTRRLHEMHPCGPPQAGICALTRLMAFPCANMAVRVCRSSSPKQSDSGSCHLPKQHRACIQRLPWHDPCRARLASALAPWVKRPPPRAPLEHAALCSWEQPPPPSMDHRNRQTADTVLVAAAAEALLKLPTPLRWHVHCRCVEPAALAVGMLLCHAICSGGICAMPACHAMPCGCRASIQAPGKRPGVPAQRGHNSHFIPFHSFPFKQAS